MPLHGLTLDLAASMGIALYPQHGATADDLMQKADVAMYAAKEMRSGFEVYSPNQHQFNTRSSSICSAKCAAPSNAASSLCTSNRRRA